MKSVKSFENSSKKEDKRIRKSTFDIKTFIPNSSDNKDESDNNIDQYKALQNFISKNVCLISSPTPPYLILASSKMHIQMSHL